MNTFISKRHQVSSTQHIKASPEKVFPLLCPKKEYDWIPGWQCEIIYSKSGYAELDCIFTTNFPDNGKEVWVVDQYVPNQLIEFIISSEQKITRYTITLTDNQNGTTTLVWEQNITSLNEEGNRQIEKLTNEAFNKKIKGLEVLLNHYLATGKMLIV